MKGRKPKPVEIRTLEGNPGKRPIKGSSAKSWLDGITSVRKKKKSAKAEKRAANGKMVVKRGKKKGVVKNSGRENGKKKREKAQVVKRIKVQKTYETVGRGTKKAVAKESAPVEEAAQERRLQRGGVEAGTPLCPAWLDSAAKREWRRIAPVLKRLGLLTVVDRAALAGYCQAYARWRQAELTVTTQGMVQTNPKSGRSEASPEVRVAQRYLEICKNFCTEFGMTPSARGRMMLPAEKEQQDEFEKMLDE